MTSQDTEVELRPGVAKQIRDKLVGRIFQVKLKGETHQADGHSPRGFARQVFSKVGIHRGPRHNQIREQKQDAAVLLTVESVEVYSGSQGEASREHVERSEDSGSDAPQLHAPPSPLEGHVYSYSISMSQVPH